MLVCDVHCTVMTYSCPHVDDVTMFFCVILLQSIRDFAHSSFQYALQKGWVLYMRLVSSFTDHDIEGVLLCYQLRYW